MEGDLADVLFELVRLALAPRHFEESSNEAAAVRGYGFSGGLSDGDGTSDPTPVAVAAGEPQSSRTVARIHRLVPNRMT